MKKLSLLLLISAASMVGNGQAGQLDPSFGVNGLIRTDFGFNAPSSVGREVLLHSDGSFYLLIEVGSNAAIAHFLSNGSLDQAYGLNGYSEIIPLFSSISESGAVLQPDGKIVIGGFGRTTGTNDFLLVRLNSNGFFDNSFSGDGKQYTDFLASDDHVTALALQSDGKILAAGYSNGIAALARYNTDGSLDNSFSADGKLTESGGKGSGVTVQSDGKILMTFGASVARYLQDGTLDNGFGSAGIASFSFLSPVAAINDVEVQSDGKIVLGGVSGTPQTVEDFLVIRLNNTGTTDNSFSGDGIQTTNFLGTSQDFGEALALDVNGKILLTGYSRSSGVISIALARYNTDGAPDNSFSGDGKLTTLISEVNISSSIALYPDSRIIIGGFTTFTSSPSSFYFAVRYNTNGNPDPGLDQDGILIDSKPGGITNFSASATQSDGKIVAAGDTRVGEEDIDFAIARYNQDGSLDNSFSGDGRATISFEWGVDICHSVKVQADGKIVVAGFGFNGNDNDFAIARLNPNGTLDNSFSDDGILLTDFNGEEDVINDLRIQPDGKIVVVGYSTSSGNRDFAIARYNTDGSPDNSFSSDGKLVIDFLPSSNMAKALVIQTDGKLLVVGDYNYNANSDLAIVRLNADGTPDLSFDGDGTLIADLGNGSPDVVNVAELQNGKLVIAGSIDIPNVGTDFSVARFNSDGSFDNSFSNDGKLNLDLGSTTEEAHALAFQANGKILVGGFLIGINTGDFALARLKSDGTPDSSFADDGISTPEIEFGPDQISALNIIGNRVYAIGSTTYGNSLGAVAAFLLSAGQTGPLTVTIPDAYALPNGVDANTVYLGYQPATSLTLFAQASGGATPYTYSWNNGATTASIQVSPNVNQTYTVTVTDDLGNTAVASKTVGVVDARCGNNLEKVLICRTQPGNSGNSNTLCVSQAGVASHLNHGAHLGPCIQGSSPELLTVSGHPNPSSGKFDIRVSSKSGNTVQLYVWDVLGKIIEKRTVNSNAVIQIGANYKPGVYFVEIVSGDKKERIKLIKLNN